MYKYEDKSIFNILDLIETLMEDRIEFKYVIDGPPHTLYIDFKDDEQAKEYSENGIYKFDKIK